MKVKELIAYLSSLDGEMEIVADTAGEYGWLAGNERFEEFNIDQLSVDELFMTDEPKRFYEPYDYSLIPASAVMVKVLAGIGRCGDG